MDVLGAISNFAGSGIGGALKSATDNKTSGGGGLADIVKKISGGGSAGKDATDGVSIIGKIVKSVAGALEGVAKAVAALFGKGAGGGTSGKVMGGGAAAAPAPEIKPASLTKPAEEKPKNDAAPADGKMAPASANVGDKHANPVPGAKIGGRPYQGTHTLGNWESDNALDFMAPEGTPIYAPADGKVTKAGGNNNDPSSRFNGFKFTLEGEGNAWFLTHLKEMTVKDGQEIKKGQLVGYVGSANGVPHLHIGQKNGNPSETFKV